MDRWGNGADNKNTVFLRSEKKAAAACSGSPVVECSVFKQIPPAAAAVFARLSPEDLQVAKQGL